MQTFRKRLKILFIITPYSISILLEPIDTNFTNDHTIYSEFTSKIIS
jgi:hypothetical protein